VDDGTFDRVARMVDRLTSRRTTLGNLAGAGLGAALSGLGLGLGLETVAGKKKKPCKKPNRKCGKKCCKAGQGCTRGKCVSCPAGSVFCEGIPGVAERGCTEGECCFGPCSGKTCCPRNQRCAPAPTTFCECTDEECGDSCCAPGQVCSGSVCGACTTGTDPCNQDPALACGCGICVTSVENNTACVTETVVECADCQDDSDCTAALGRPGLCVAIDCGPCPAGQKICIGICP
jgi:hypothetical protein